LPMPAKTKKEAVPPGKRKAAILLKMLDLDDVANVTQHLNQLDVEELAHIATNIKNIPENELNNVVSEFSDLIPSTENTVSFNSDFATELLNRPAKQERYFALDFIQRADLKQLVDIMRNEHPQVIAFILSYLPHDKAGKIMSHISPGSHIDLVYRISNMETPHSLALKYLDKMLNEKLSCLASSSTIDVGGLDSLVKIMRKVGRNAEKQIIENLEKEYPDLCEQIKQRMFIFEDIVLLDNRSVQKVLKEVDMKTLALSLKKASEEIKDLISSNLSERARGALMEEINSMGKVPLRDVESAQQEVVETIRRMEEQGEITIRREEEIYV